MIIQEFFSYFHGVINALIFDDEAAAATVLQLMIERHVPEITNLRIATTCQEAFALIEQFKPSLVFQDIVMPQMNGFEFLSRIKNIGFDIIFTTAYNDYAIQAIRLSALDYLVKPINADELCNAVNRFLEKQQTQNPTGPLFQNLIENLSNNTQFKLAVPTIKGALFFSISEIMRLEAEGNYTHFYLSNNRKYISAKTLKDYSLALEGREFIRIHKSHFVNRLFIKSFQNEGSITLADDTVLPVSRQRKQEVFNRLKS